MRKDYSQDAITFIPTSCVAIGTPTLNPMPHRPVQRLSVNPSPISCQSANTSPVSQSTSFRSPPLNWTITFPRPIGQSKTSIETLQRQSPNPQPAGCWPNVTHPILANQLALNHLIYNQPIHRQSISTQPILPALAYSYIRFPVFWNTVLSSIPPTTLCQSMPIKCQSVRTYQEDLKELVLYGDDYSQDYMISPGSHWHHSSPIRVNQPTVDQFVSAHTIHCHLSSLQSKSDQHILSWDASPSLQHIHLTFTYITEPNSNCFQWSSTIFGRTANLSYINSTNCQLDNPRTHMQSIATSPIPCQCQMKQN